ncbi:MAG: signal peptide peptidase SppA [Cyclobacteriaceae bacterium]|nr:signal peptide peptidase SppA [Cyclobacteriaceae bacterium]
MFLRNVLATIVGLVIFSIVVFFIFLGMITAISATDDGVEISDNTILHLKLDRPILERSADSPLSDLQLLGAPTGVGVKELRQAVERAAVDDRISGIYLETQFMYAGLSKLKEFREALETFKESGKFLVAHSEYYTESEYYLASAADEIYLPEEGFLEFNGFRAEYNFLKGGLDKLGVQPQVFRVGAYKSAVEPFTRTDMSPEAREQLESLLASVYEIYLDDISSTRNVDSPTLDLVADSMLATSAKNAAAHKLISGTLYHDEVMNLLKEKAEVEEDDDLKLVGLNAYLSSSKEIYQGKERIAVVFAEGEIINGKGDPESIGTDIMVKELTKLREDDKIKAIVLRINSPGGSSLASDVIWRELKKTSETKPVIASMSDVAASGGYYLAMACDTIVAQPTTITGSIGIYSMHFNAQELLEDKLGITTDVAKTGPLADIFTVSRPLTEYEKSLFQKSVDDGYETFTSKAAEDRDMKLDDLKAIAQGRVWSGVQAKENGLVDVLGGLQTAVEIAAAAAGVEEDNYKLRYYPAQKTLWEQLMSDFGADIEEAALKTKLGDLYPYVKQLRNLDRYQGLQTRMPFDLSIH